MLQQIKTKAILVLAFLLGVISVDMLAQQSVSETPLKVYYRMVCII